MKDFSQEFGVKYVGGKFWRERFGLPKSAEDLKSVYAEWNGIGRDMYDTFLEDTESKIETIKNILKRERTKSPKTEKLMELIEYCEACSRDIREEIIALDEEEDSKKRSEINERIVEKADELNYYYNRIIKLFFELYGGKKT